MGHWFLAVWIAAFSCDAISTHVSIYKGAHEAFIPSQQPWAIDAILATEAVGGWWAATEFYKEHPKLTKFMVITAIAAHGAASYHNFRVMPK